MCSSAELVEKFFFSIHVCLIEKVFTIDNVLKKKIQKYLSNNNLVNLLIDYLLIRPHNYDKPSCLFRSTSYFISVFKYF